MDSAGRTHLRRDIGFVGAALMVLNGLIGAGIFALPGKVAANAGLLSPWLFLVVGLFFLAVVLSFAELASYYEQSGGPVLYARDAFGPVAGFATGWILFISRVAAFAANATVMALYLGSLEPWFATGIGRAAVISLVTLGLTWANVLGVRDGVRTMAVFSILKLTPLLLLVLAGLGEVTATTLIPAGPYFFDELGSTALLLVYAYVGFETMAVTAGETKNPRKNLPGALVRTVLMVGFLYFLIVLVFVSEVDPVDYGTATLIDVGRKLAGPVGAIGITICAVFSIGGNLSQSILAAPRLLFSLAENRLLPASFRRIHPRYSTPDVAIVASGLLALGLALSGTFVQLAVASSLARLIVYIVCILALPAIRRAAPDRVRDAAFRLRGGYTIPLVGLGICGWLMLHTTRDNWSALGVLLAIGIGLYALEKRVLKSRE